MSRLSILILPCLAIALLAIAPASSTESGSQTKFFEHMKALCGSRFAGHSNFPEDPGDAFRGKLLVVVFETCSEREIRIPFHVGRDQSRTWLLTRVAGGLQLKHDHRHADGTPDEITLYGGTTQSPGSELSQSFPADNYTAGLIPDAASNEWFLSLSANKTELVYYLERHGKPRFRAILQRVD